eukprot:7217434-Prymnesium_polylepis.2
MGGGSTCALWCAHTGRPVAYCARVFSLGECPACRYRQEALERSVDARMHRLEQMMLAIAQSTGAKLPEQSEHSSILDSLEA